MFKMRKNTIKNSIFVVLTPILLYGFLGPLEVYAATPADFCVSMWTVLFWFSVASAIAFVIALIVLIFLPKKISLFLRKACLIFALVSYFQYLFLNKSLARMDGNFMDWEGVKTSSILNMAIWIAIILLLVFCIKKYCKGEKWNIVSNYISACINLILTVTVIYLLIITPKGSDDAYRLSAKEQYTLAKDNNVIILVIDSLGNKQFAGMMNQYPEMDKSLKDFTYFDNCDSHYDRTYPTMTAMITGYEYDFNYQNPDEYTTKAWTSTEANEFFDILHENDWTMNIYACNEWYPYGNLECATDKIDNAEFMEGKV